LTIGFASFDDRLREQRESKRTSTDAGISMVLKLLPANADSSSRCNFEFDSNLTDVSDLHLEKQDLHTTSTEAGISMVFKSLSRNADSSIRCNFEFDSNVTDASDLQLEKQ
jgi:hypothetical protein